MLVYVIRHGQSVANARSAHAGWSQIPLTEKGVDQAKRTGELVKDIKFDKVISSDLLRAIQTSEYALPGYEKQTDPRIREISVGSLADRLVVDCEEELGEIYIRNRQLHDFTPYGGENMDDLLNRNAEFLESLCAEPADSKIAVVCHGGAIFAMLCHVLGTKLPRHAADVENCSVCVFEYKKGQWSLVKWNETGIAEPQGF